MPLQHHLPLPLSFHGILNSISNNSMAFLLPNLPSSLPLQPKTLEKPSNFSPSTSSSSSSSSSSSPLTVHLIKNALLSATPSRNTKLEPPPLRGAGIKEAPDKQDDEKNNFYVNLGLAVRTLREDVPQIFTKELNYDIYRDDVTFIDPLNTFTGIDKYKLIFWALRFHGRILFRDIDLQVLRIWQPSENTILIRWNLNGIPRVPWEAKGHFQGTSWYKLDRKGKIYEHKVDNLAFNFPQPLKPAASVLDLVTAIPANPNPTFLWDQPELYPSSWLKFYKAVKETLDHEACDLLPRDAILVSCS